MEPATSAEQLAPAAGLFAGLAPEPKLTVSEWSDSYRFLSPEASSTPGKWQTSRTPYLREIMDMLSAKSSVQTVIFMKAAQIGATEAGNNWIGYIIDNAPGPTLMVMPTDETVKRNSNGRITPMIEATPRLQSKVGPASKKDSGNTTYSKKFPGGVLVLTGANSAVGLRSMPVRYLFLDEIDGYPLDLDGEGSPLTLAIARTRTFARRKIFMPSTPTLEGTSVVAAEFEATDQRYYFVPCPECGTAQKLVFDNLRWDKASPEKVTYECAHCRALIPERFKIKMLKQGYWEATRPDNASATKVGYHLNSLYSPWYHWSEIVADWIAAQGKPDKLKVFVNTLLGETWKAPGESPDWQTLYERRAAVNFNDPVPNEVGVITVGVDVQKNRIECEVIGWGRGLKTWGLGYHVLQGDTSEAAVWDALAEVIAGRYLREDGNELTIRGVAVDSGYNPQQTYKFVKKYPTNRVFPVKGSEGLMVPVSAPKAIQIRKDGKRIGTQRLQMVGTGILKTELYGWLKLQGDETGTPAGYCAFPAEYDNHYFKMLTAEKLVYTRNAQGHGKYVWVKSYERNEALDCRVYARAAAVIVGVDRLKPADWLKLGAVPAVSSPPAPDAGEAATIKPDFVAASKVAAELLTAAKDGKLPEFRAKLKAELAAAEPPVPAPKPTPKPKPVPVKKPRPKGDFWKGR